MEGSFLSSEFNGFLILFHCRQRRLRLSVELWTHPSHQHFNIIYSRQFDGVPREPATFTRSFLKIYGFSLLLLSSLKTCHGADYLSSDFRIRLNEKDPKFSNTLKHH